MYAISQQDEAWKAPRAARLHLGWPQHPQHAGCTTTLQHRTLREESILKGLICWFSITEPVQNCHPFFDCEALCWLVIQLSCFSHLVLLKHDIICISKIYISYWSRYVSPTDNRDRDAGIIRQPNLLYNYIEGTWIYDNTRWPARRDFATLSYITLT